MTEEREANTLQKCSTSMSHPCGNNFTGVAFLQLGCDIDVMVLVETQP